MDRQFAPTEQELLSSISETLTDMRDLLVGIYIQNLRIYDMLALSDNPQVDELIEKHALGETLCPEPTLKQND